MDLDDAAEPAVQQDGTQLHLALTISQSSGQDETQPLSWRKASITAWGSSSSRRPEQSSKTGLKDEERVSDKDVRDRITVHNGLVDKTGSKHGLGGVMPAQDGTDTAACFKVVIIFPFQGHGILRGTFRGQEDGKMGLSGDSMSRG